MCADCVPGSPSREAPVAPWTCGKQALNPSLQRWETEAQSVGYGLKVTGLPRGGPGLVPSSQALSTLLLPLVAPVGPCLQRPGGSRGVQEAPREAKRVPGRPGGP